MNDSRKFPALLPSKVSWLNKSYLGRSLEQYLTFYLLFFFVFLFIVAFLLLKQLEQVKNTHAQEVKQLMYWQSITGKYPLYPDGFYKAAVSEAKLRNKRKAIEYLDAALKLDPFFKQAQNLRNTIAKEWWL